MNNRKIKIKNILKFIIIFIVCAGIFYFVSYEKIKYDDIGYSVNNIENNIGEIVEGDVIRQTFRNYSDILTEISISIATYARSNTGSLIIDLVEEENILMYEWVFDISTLEDNSILTLNCDNLKLKKGNEYSLVVTTRGSTYGNAMTLYTSNTTSILEGTLYRNGDIFGGELNLAYNGYTYNTERNYIIITFIILIGIAYFICIIMYLFKKGILYYINLDLKKYKFLMKQLIARDFKTKYKRSSLGFFWSFLNPVLTMLVQYIVFSTLFRSDIQNFPVYLLSAGIVFNFFTESVGMGLTSIVSNTALITKVHIPKYIYPLTRVLSTAINLFISLIPLLVVVLVTGEHITKGYLVIPFLLICLIIFCIGMSLILSTCMVYFRDTQFLWGIASLIWMYATPIFYPETIIPENFQIILKINPMYHFLKFFRTILIGGGTPELIEYIACFSFAIVFLIVGSVIFQRHQKRFVLYL